LILENVPLERLRDPKFHASFLTKVKEVVNVLELAEKLGKGFFTVMQIITELMNIHIDRREALPAPHRRMVGFFTGLIQDKHDLSMVPFLFFFHSFSSEAYWSSFEQWTSCSSFRLCCGTKRCLV
jgi:hypothetical protein